MIRSNDVNFLTGLVLGALLGAVVVVATIAVVIDWPSLCRAIGYG